MTTFKFTALGKTFTIKAADRSSAMVAANRHFPLGAGCWFDTTKTEFRWVEGNFFD
jgi:hypothetical protein